MSEIRAVLNSDQSIKAILNNDTTVKAILLSGVTVNQKIDGGEYLHFDVTEDGNNQIFTNSALSQYITNTSINLFKNGVYIPPSDFDKVGNTSIRMNVPLATGDGLDILATGSAALAPIANSQPGGTNQQIQFNDVGSLAGSSGLIYDVNSQTTSMTNAIVGTIEIDIANINTLDVQNINIANFAPPNINSNNANFTSLVVTESSNLNRLNVTGNTVLGNLSITGSFVPSLLTAGNLTVTGTSNFGLPTNVKITGGTNGYVLQTDGSGNLSWTAQTGGGGGNGVPGGSNSQVQYNDSGVFGGSAAFTFNETTNTLAATNVSGLITTPAQPNITSLGNVTNLTVVGNVSGGSVRTNNLQYANGLPFVFTAVPGGSNAQVQFNDNGNLGGDSTFVYNKTTDTLTVVNIAGNGSQLTNVAAVTAQTATSATTAATVTNSVQSNITALGTLNGLTVSGNLNASLFVGNGSAINNLNGSNVTGIVPLANYASFAGNVTIGNQPNITQVGTQGILNVTGNIIAGNVISTFFGSGAGLYNLPGANVTGVVPNATFATSAASATTATSASSATTATTAQTVTVSSQPNITSTGTLISLNVTGSAAANSVRTNNLQYANGSNWVFETYSNANVESYLPTYAGTLSPSILTTGNIQVTGGQAQSLAEPVLLAAFSPTATQNIDLITNTIWYFRTATAQATVLNIRGNSSNTLNAYLAIGSSLTFSVILTNPTSGTGFYVTGLSTDGTTQNINWVGGAPTSQIGGLSVYIFTIIKTAANTFTVIGNRGVTL
jgi:hypothetical protein